MVITSGAGGIGQTLSKQLIKQGARCGVRPKRYGRTPSDALFSLASDIICRDQLANAHETMIEKFGTIDVLFNNVGITHMSQFVDTPASLFEKNYGGKF